MATAEDPAVDADAAPVPFGLFVAFGARPPVTVTDAAQERYWREMEAADAFDAAPRLEAERDLARAAAATRRR